MDNNSVHIVGKVKRDAWATELRDDMRILNFTLVVEMEGEKPLYVDCAAMNEACDSIDGYVERDEILAVDGWLTHRTYTGADGRVRTSMVVMADRVMEF